MNFPKSALTIALVFGMSSVALAYPVNTDITIYDGATSGSNLWYSGQGTGSEDDETEPGTVRSQEWDLEGMFTHGTNLLGMVGGYNFYNTNGGDWRPGDIFIDVDGIITPGGPTGNTNTTNTFGYEYVLDINWSLLTYDVYSITPSAIVTTVFYGINSGSNPWRYVSGGTSLGSGSFTSETGLANGTVGKLGGTTAGYSNLNGQNTHYAAYGFDLGFLPVGTVFTAHFTSSCGNDNLMGSSTVVPVPAAVWLLGSALGLLGVVRRRARS